MERVESHMCRAYRGDGNGSRKRRSLAGAPRAAITSPVVLVIALLMMMLSFPAPVAAGAPTPGVPVTIEPPTGNVPGVVQQDPLPPPGPPQNLTPPPAKAGPATKQVAPPPPDSLKNVAPPPDQAGATASLTSPPPNPPPSPSPPKGTKAPIAVDSPPNAPYNLGAYAVSDPTSGAAYFYWSEDTPPAVTKYSVYYWNGFSWAFTDFTTNKYYTFNSLKFYKTYYFLVCAHNNLYTCSTTYATVTTFTDKKPNAPTGLGGYGDSTTSVTVSWSEVIPPFPDGY